MPSLHLWIEMITRLNFCLFLIQCVRIAHMVVFVAFKILVVALAIKKGFLFYSWLHRFGIPQIGTCTVFGFGFCGHSSSELFQLCFLRMIKSFAMNFNMLATAEIWVRTSMGLYMYVGDFKVCLIFDTYTYIHILILCIEVDLNTKMLFILHKITNQDSY